MRCQGFQNSLSSYGTDRGSVRGFRLTKGLEKIAFPIEDNSIIVVDLLSGKTRLREELPATISYFEFSHDGSRMFVGMWDNGARLFDVEAGREVWRIEDNHSYGYPVFSSDSEVFAVTRTGSTAHISGSGDGAAFYDGRSSSRLAPREKEVVVFSNGSFHEPLVEADDVQQLGPISLSNKGELFAYIELERGEISILDISTRQISHNIKASLTVYSEAHFSRSDDKLAFVAEDGYWQKVKVIDLNTMELVFEAKVAATITSIALASRADILTWSDENGIIRIADLEQNKIVARYSVNEWAPEAGFSSGDGHLVYQSEGPIHLLSADPHKFMSRLCIHLRSLIGESSDVQCSGVR